MNTFLRNALAALVVATAGVTASAPAATAGDFSFGFSIGGPGGGVVVRDRDHRGGWNRFEGHRGWDRGYCKPRKALKKARRMGLRRTDIIRANHRRVVVRGFDRGYPVRVVFANERRCPVIRIRH
jgi:hypothetical protein